jgi:chaperonin GroES
LTYTTLLFLYNILAALPFFRDAGIIRTKTYSHAGRRTAVRIRPLSDWIVLEQGEKEGRSPGGIIIPEVAKEAPQWGYVISVGPGAYESEGGKKQGEKEKKRFVAAEVKPGDRVLYEKYMAKEFEQGGQKIIMVREAYVLGVFGSRAGEGTALQKKGTTAVEKPRRGTTALEKPKKPASKKKTKK